MSCCAADSNGPIRWRCAMTPCWGCRGWSIACAREIQSNQCVARFRRDPGQPRVLALVGAQLPGEQLETLGRHLVVRPGERVQICTGAPRFTGYQVDLSRLRRPVLFRAGSGASSWMPCEPRSSRVQPITVGRRSCAVPPRGLPVQQPGTQTVPAACFWSRMRRAVAGR